VVYDYGKLTPSVYFWVWDLLLVGLLLNYMRMFDKKKGKRYYYPLSFLCVCVSVFESFKRSIGWNLSFPILIPATISIVIVI